MKGFRRELMEKVKWGSRLEELHGSSLLWRALGAISQRQISLKPLLLSPQESDVFLPQVPWVLLAPTMLRNLSVPFWSHHNLHLVVVIRSILGKHLVAHIIFRHVLCGNFADGGCYSIRKIWNFFLTFAEGTLSPPWPEGTQGQLYLMVQNCLNNRIITGYLPYR